jgi:hypothetical protein
MQQPTSLDLFQIIVVVGSFAVGLLHALAATGKIFSLVSVPTKVLPYLATFGTFLAGFVAYVQSAGKFDGTTAFYAVFLGGGPALIAGMSASIVAHVAFGSQVNAKRPSPEPVIAAPPASGAKP